jgi:hypothetical protein
MPTEVKKSTLYYPDRAPIRVQLEVVLKSSPDDVWKTFVDCRTWSKWYPDLVSCFESTPLTKVADNNPSYPLGSTRRVDIAGVVFDEEIIAYDGDGETKVWAFSVYQTSKKVLTCCVERVVFEPLYDDDGPNKTVVGTRIRYAAGLDLVWYLFFLKPVFERNMKRCWTEGFRQLDLYVEEQTKAAAKS